jgi:hypothetical protein
MAGAAVAGAGECGWRPRPGEGLKLAPAPADEGPPLGVVPHQPPEPRGEGRRVRRGVTEGARGVTEGGRRHGGVRVGRPSVHLSRL